MMVLWLILAALLGLVVGWAAHGLIVGRRLRRELGVARKGASERDRLAGAAVDLEDEGQRLRDQLDECTRAATTCEHEVASLQARLASYADLEASLEVTRADLEASRARVDALTGDLDRAVQLATVATSAPADPGVDHAAVMEAELARLRSDHATRRQRIADLESQLRMATRPADPG